MQSAQKKIWSSVLSSRSASEPLDFVRAFRSHSDLLAKMPMESAKPGRFARLASRPAGEKTGQNIINVLSILEALYLTLATSKHLLSE